MMHYPSYVESLFAFHETQAKITYHSNSPGIGNII